MKTSRIILATVVTLVAGIGFSVPRGFSQTPVASYEQTASLDGGQLGYDQINVTGPFSLTGPDSTAQTDIGTPPVVGSNGLLTLNGTATSEVVNAAATSLTNFASTFAQYYVEVDSSVSPSVLIDIVGSVSGSVGTTQGEATTAVALGDNVINGSELDILTGQPDVNTPLDQSFTISTNVPSFLELDTSATVFSGSGPGTVSATIDPYVQVDPHGQDLALYTLKFFIAPVPEPTVGMMLVGGLGLLLTFQRMRKRL